MNDLDTRVMGLARRDLPLARALLQEAIRIPHDHVDRPEDGGGDRLSGLSNHEGPRLAMLREMIVAHRAVADPRDVWFDGLGNLVWTVSDPHDDTPPEDKKVIYLDGHSDTVAALRDGWREKLGGALDPYLGRIDGVPLEASKLARELGWLPPEDEWGHLIFGRGSADQLAGVVSQIVATRILLELAPYGALRGVIVRSYATVTEEDHDGAGPRHIVAKTWREVAPHELPDVVILTEGTGDAGRGALGIYRGQRGRMQIEMTVTGRSCHGSMPWMGKNPLELGGAIVAEAALAYERGEGFLDDAFLGRGTRTASWCRLDTPSDCAVPERFVVRFDRRLTAGETADMALAAMEQLPSVAAGRARGFDITFAVPLYEATSWTGHAIADPQLYPGWVTPENHPAITSAVATYRRVVTPTIERYRGGGHLNPEPRVERWIFSTDGVGFPVPIDDTRIAPPARKRWVEAAGMRQPAMFGIGAGHEQNTHKIGECVDSRELERAIAFLARFPSVFAAGVEP